MGAFYSRQPNGKICRFSSVVECPTDWDMSDEEFVEWYAEQAREQAIETAKFILKCELRPFNRVIDDFAPYNMTVEEFKEALKSMGHSGEIEEKEWWKKIKED